MSILPKTYKYLAFISYKSEDKKWAKWIVKGIEDFHIPVRHRVKDLTGEKVKIFFDKRNLGIGILPEQLKEALDDSKYLIVICSPRSAQKCWVNDEIAYFTKHHPTSSIILLIIDGNPHSGENECFNEEILKLNAELLAANINDGKKQAFIKIMAYMLGIKYDEFWNVYRHHQIRYIIKKSIFSACIFTLIIFSIMPKHINFNLEEGSHCTLPFKGALLTIYSIQGNKQHLLGEHVINNLNRPLELNNLPSIIMINKIRINIKSLGFEDIDTILSYRDKITIQLMRNNIYGEISGVINDEETGLPLNGAEIRIQKPKMKVETNHLGFFKICIPLNAQTEFYDVIISKRGYKTDTLYQQLPSLSWKRELQQDN